MSFFHWIGFSNLEFLRIESTSLFLNVNTQWWEQQWWNKITINNSKENQKTPISVLAEAKACIEDTYQATYNTKKKKTTTILIETKMSNNIKLKPAHFSSGIKHSICHKLWTKRKKYKIFQKYYWKKKTFITQWHSKNIKQNKYPFQFWLK